MISRSVNISSSTTDHHQSPIIINHRSSSTTDHHQPPIISTTDHHLQSITNHHHLDIVSLQPHDHQSSSPIIIILIE